GTVRFLLAEERTGTLRYAPLQGRTFRVTVPEDRRLMLPDSIVLDSGDGELRIRSEAIIFILQRLGGLWTVLGTLLWIVPRPLRDLGYDAIGAVRYRVFGRAPELCPLVAPELRRRVLAE
ncbi:MAG: thiol-disulfide oxidoreductase DCC family protein, partial [Gammaproteobacteria bacterium]